ncbi:MAG: M20/M25/M40 family metallo-hydrolase [Planctomycetia bacterium]|nr:M20/M25/M40 family metallo-hydrolase [Planctomycetia bacterium]
MMRAKQSPAFWPQLSWIVRAAMVAGLAAWAIFPNPTRSVSALAAEKANSSFSAAFDSIRPIELKRNVDALAADNFEGREAGSRGGRAASIYVTEQLRRTSLKPAGIGGTYFQPFGNGDRNILAMLEGSDPKLKSQIILVGAHYDHVGYGKRGNSFGPFGLIHHGADDNASGVAGLLSLAEAFSMLEPRPKRSILFAFWDGEEAGLLGSQYFVDNPTLPLKRIALAVNLDMIGRLRDDTLKVFGTRTAPGLRQLVDESNRRTDLTLDFTREMKRNSDHFTFFERDVPIVMLHTGLHADYHRPSDVADKVNVAGMQRVSQLLFTLVDGAANADRLGNFRAVSHREPWEAPEETTEPVALPPGRLGVEWSTSAAEPQGLTISTVRAGSAASRAGLRTGDKIIQCDQKAIESGKDLRAAIVVAPSAIRLSVIRPGEPQPRDFDVKLDGRPQRLGLSWWEDDAEPGVLIIAGVTHDAPADQAGIHAGDRIIELSGKPVGDSAGFQRNVAKSEGTVDLLVERKGHLLTLHVTLPPLVRADAVDVTATPADTAAPKPKAKP